MQVYVLIARRRARRCLGDQVADFDDVVTCISE